MTPITWTRERRKLSQLLPWEHNPKQLTEKQAQHLAKSIRKFGLVHALAISPDGLIYDGNSRDKLLLIMDEYGEDAEIDVRVSSRPLTQEEHDELIIRLKENTGEYDWDILANTFDVEKLGEWGMPEWKIEKPGGWNGEGIDPSLIPDDGRYKEQYGVIIICSDSAEQETVYNKMNDSGYMCRVVVT